MKISTVVHRKNGGGGGLLEVDSFLGTVTDFGGGGEGRLPVTLFVYATYSTDDLSSTAKPAVNLTSFLSFLP